MCLLCLMVMLFGPAPCRRQPHNKSADAQTEKKKCVREGAEPEREEQQQKTRKIYRSSESYERDKKSQATRFMLRTYARIYDFPSTLLNFCCWLLLLLVMAIARCLAFACFEKTKRVRKWILYFLSARLLLVPGQQQRPRQRRTHCRRVCANFGEFVLV